MPNLRVFVELNKGERGIQLAKLSSIAGDVHRFFSMLSEDLSFEEPEKWIAVEFANGSLKFVAEKVRSASIDEIGRFNAAFESIATRHPAPEIRRSTVAQFAKIADPIADQEAVSFGLYPVPMEPQAEGEPEESGVDFESEELAIANIARLRRYDLTKSEAAAIQAEIQASVKAYGSLQGRNPSLF